MVREWSAKPSCIGSIPIAASSMGAKRSFFWENLPPEKLWYLVGLITSDGSLNKDGRHIEITSKEFDFLAALKYETGLSVVVGQKKNGLGDIAFRIQFGSKSFYSFLQNVGLMSNKSKKLGSLNVPDQWFQSFLRGVIDGDGCIRHWQNQWYFKVNSGSETFLIWLQNKLDKLFNVSGHVYFEEYRASSGYILKVSSKAGVTKILTECYNNDEFSLNRKKIQALCFLKNAA